MLYTEECEITVYPLKYRNFFVKCNANLHGIRSAKKKREHRKMRPLKKNSGRGEKKIEDVGGDCEQDGKNAKEEKGMRPSCRLI